MAKVKTTHTQEQIQEQAPQAQNAYKAWEDRNNDERIASINEYAKIMLAGAMKTKNADWQKNMSSEQIDNTMPFNASTGKPYAGLSSMILRSAVTMNNYENSEFLTMQQANKMGGVLKKDLDKNGEIKQTANGKTQYVKGVKVAFYKEYEYKPKLDSQGNQLYNTFKDKNGLDYKQLAMEKVYLKEPKIETITLYHSSQFNNLDKSKLVQRDLTQLKQNRIANKDKSYDIRPKVNALNLGANASNDINNFMNSQNKGIDYEKINHKILNQNKVQTKEKNLERNLF